MHRADDARRVTTPFLVALCSDNPLTPMIQSIHSVETYSVSDALQFVITGLKKLMELLSVIGGIAFAVGGHAQNDQGVFDFGNAREFILKNTSL